MYLEALLHLKISSANKDSLTLKDVISKLAECTITPTKRASENYARKKNCVTESNDKIQRMKERKYFVLLSKMQQRKTVSSAPHSLEMIALDFFSLPSYHGGKINGKII